MYGVRAAELLRELKRSRTLPPYDARGVEEVHREINDIYEHVKVMVRGGDVDASHPYIATPLVVYDQSINRNKRCLLAYHVARLNIIKEIRWDTGVPFPEDLEGTLGAPEKKFFKDYSELVEDYMGSLGLDLTSDLQPPKDMYCVVRVLKETGEIMTEDGPLGTTHLMRWSEAEKLVRKGVLDHMWSKVK